MSKTSNDDLDEEDLETLEEALKEEEHLPEEESEACGD